MTHLRITDQGSGPCQQWRLLADEVVAGQLAVPRQRADDNLVAVLPDEIELADGPLEQVVPDRASDNIGVEAERVHIGGDGASHAAIVRVRPGSDQSCAIASISTSAPEGSPATSTVERAGGRSPICRA